MTRAPLVKAVEGCQPLILGETHPKGEGSAAATLVRERQPCWICSLPKDSLPLGSGWAGVAASAGRLKTCLWEHSALQPHLEGAAHCQGHQLLLHSPAPATPLSRLDPTQHSPCLSFPAPMASWLPGLLGLCAPQLRGSPSATCPLVQVLWGRCLPVSRPLLGQVQAPMPHGHVTCFCQQGVGTSGSMWVPACL